MRKLLATLFCLWAPVAMAQPFIPATASTQIEGSHVFCKGPCKLFTGSLTSGASAGFWMVFNLNFDPPDGTLPILQAPKYCWPWQANTGNGYSWPIGVQFTIGMTFVFSTGADCLHKQESATAFFTAQVQ
jgi:hypothetical protein